MAEKYQTREERRKQMQANKNKKQKNKKPKSKFVTFLKRLILVCFLLGLAGLIAGISTFAYYASNAPKLSKKQLSDPIPSVIKDSSNHTVTTLGTQNREYIDYEQLPGRVEDAVLSTEDARFYKHFGIDPIRLGGAVIANFTRGFGSEGASTLTQQVVKMATSNDVKTLKRKAQEAWLAVQLERKYTKHEILEMYVNKVYMSDGIFGFETAAEHYYGKSLSKLSLPEIAMIAGMPQSPNNYNPYDHPDLAEKRRNIVLSLMYQNNKITKAEMQKAKAVPISEGLVKQKDRNSSANKYTAFVNEVIDEVQDLGDYNVYSDGLTIYTTLDTRAQKYTEKILNSNSVVSYPDKQFQAGIALIDTKTGEIRALGGGRNMKVQRGFNYAVDTKRSPGSTIKPIIDYGPAIEYLKWSTAHKLNDVKTTYSNGTEINNWDNKYLGAMTMRTALYKSRNIPALEAYKTVGGTNAVKFSKKLGFNFGDDGLKESASIGGGLQVSPVQMAAAYAAFGNQGIYNKPHTIKKIVLRDGVTEIKPHYESKIAMSDYTAYMITDMLKDVLTKGTGTSANVPGLIEAGKTGTTNFSDEDLTKYGILSSSVPDAWFTGYTTRYSLSVWTGYESKDGKKYGITRPYQTIAQQIYRHLMSYISEDKTTSDFTMPKSVVRLPSGSGAYELFIRGHQDTAIANTSKLAAPTNASAVYDEASKKINLTWKYTESGATYNITGSVDGTGKSYGTTTGKSLSISNPVAGATYTFNITATLNGMTSKAATAKVTIPGGDDDASTDKQTNSDDEDHSDDQNANDSSTDQNAGNQNGNADSNNSNSSGNDTNGSGSNGNNSSNNGNSPNQNSGSDDNNSNDDSSNHNNSGDNHSNGNDVEDDSGGSNDSSTTNGSGEKKTDSGTKDNQDKESGKPADNRNEE
ncbi:transglycosylase domain-containing protein [Heyndrickxia acidiproducens]|uniref:transglycosylase domain-containing protein n=1 Tax=Heyndrickxia acidiproducens TaxID=1121084 RepID=UPI000380390C|nr:PBP1A family penicillin-binding protein [Heyndrickxia acidiproducens]